MFSSIGRLLRALFGFAESKTDGMTAKLLESPDTIHGVFKEQRRLKKSEYDNLRASVASMIHIHDERAKSLEESKNRLVALQNKAKACVEEFQKSQDEKWRALYCDYAEQAEEFIKSIQSDEEIFNTEEEEIAALTEQLKGIQKEITNLSKQENEAVVAIISAKRQRELNDNLLRLGDTKSTKLLNAVNDAVAQAKAQAKLSANLSGANRKNFEESLERQGKRAQLLSQFDQACKVLPAASEERLNKAEE